MGISPENITSSIRKTTMLRKNAVWLCGPPAFLSFLDALVTLYGQSASYWSGNYQCVNEISPTFNQLLHIHPGAFLLGGAAWIVVLSAMILLLPEVLALSVAMAITLGHITAINSWIGMLPPHGYAISNLLSAVGSLILVVFFKRGQSESGESAIDWKRTGLPGWTRWMTIACLAVVPIYLFLIPR
jgi:hypothetical protein